MNRTFGSYLVTGLRRGAVTGFCVLAALTPSGAGAQQVISQSQATYQVPIGTGSVIIWDTDVTRVQIVNPAVAEVEAVEPPRQLLIRGIAVGTTGMLVWDITGVPRIYTIEVIPDLLALRTQLETIFPDIDIQLTTTGNSIIVSGTVRDPTIISRIISLASATGATVINNIQAPSAEQILLHVRFAEIRRSALRRFANDLFVQNVADVDNVVGEGSVTDVVTLSEGIVNLILTGQQSRLEAVIRALRSSGEFRSLAEPNLITLEGQEATFLAGGEFPYPTVQTGGTTQNAVTIAFREFGVRLRFTPQVLYNGAIRLHVAPEVSSLDFANGITISGFQLPSLLSRKAETNVELLPGQHLAIAGLLDNQMLEAVDKIPFLGDLPIVGALFRSKLNQQDRTELLILVTPHLIQPSDVPPPLPMGEPLLWRWDRNMRMHPDSIGRTMPQMRRGAGGNTR